MRFFLLLLLVFIFTSCRDFDEYSEIPKIEFVSLDFYQTVRDENQMKIASLTFNLYDGDSDIGVDYTDTTVNFFTEVLVMKNGEFINAEEAGIVDNNYKMPQIPEDDRDINFEAEVTVDIEYFSALMPYDTLKYQFYIVDYAGNKSNIEESTIAILNQPNTQEDL